MARFNFFNKNKLVKVWGNIIICFLLFFSGIQTSAQEYKIISYTTKQGLHNNLTKAVTEDSLGFVWVGTDSGLERFNGLTFRSFTNGLPSGYVKSFFKTNNKELLAITDMGVVQINYQPDTAYFTIIARGSSTYTDSLLFYPKFMMEDQHHNYWISDNNSVWQLRNGQLKKYTFDKKNFSINFQRTYPIIENAAGEIYVFSETGYTFRYNRQLDTFEELSSIPKLPSVDGAKFIDNSRVLIASYSGLLLLDLATGNVTSVLPVDACQIEKINDQVYMVACWTSGVYKITITNGAIESEQIKSIESIKINGLFVDKKNNLWVTTDFGIILGQNMPFNNNTQLLNKYFVQSVDIAPNGNVYCIAGGAYSIANNNEHLVTNQIFSLNEGGNLSQITASRTDSSLVYIASNNARLFALKNNK